MATNDHDGMHNMTSSLKNVEPAADVSDLDTARRMITVLRNMIASQDESHTPVFGEYTAFLDEEHDEMLLWLYSRKRLLSCGPRAKYWLDPPDLDEAFTDFVEGAIDLAHDIAKFDEEEARAKRRKQRKQRKQNPL